MGMELYRPSDVQDYIVPNVLETTSRGERYSDIFSRLLKDRIIFLGTPIDDACANDVMAQLNCLESTPAAHTGRPEATVRADIERDLFLTAEQAVAYGVADQVVPSRKEGS